MNDGLLLSILVSTSNCDVCVLTKNIKKMLSCVLHTANTLTYFERFFYIQKILEVLKMYFRMDFLNTTKIVFLHFWILQHVCKTPKGISQYSKKYKNLILGGGEFIYYSPLMFG